MARQLTLAAMAVMVAVGVWKLTPTGGVDLQEYLTPLVVLAVGWWASFRIVNLPKFADFLISVEAEMNKVAWPGRSELWRASIVVIIVIFFLAALLYIYDIILGLFMGILGL